MEGYVLIDTQVGRAEEVAGAVRSLGGVAAVELVRGPYDIVARARRRAESGLVRDLAREIADLPGVTRVVVCPVTSPVRMWEMGTEPALSIGR